MGGVYFEDISSRGLVHCFGGVGLGLLESLHVSRLTVFTGNDDAGVIDESLGDNDIFELVLEEGLPPVNEGGEHFFEFLLSSSGGIVVVGEFELSFSDVHEFFFLVLVKVSEDIFIDGVVEEKHFVSLLE